MSIFVTSATDLVALINTAGGVAFPLADITFGKPRTPTAAEVTKYGKNTAVDFKVADTSTIATGFTTVFYDRLDLKGLENFDLTGCSISSGIGIAGWLPILIGYLNIPFSQSNLVDTTSSAVDGKVVVSVQAVPASLGWFGTGTLKFENTPDISTAFNSNQLTGF